MSDDGTFSKILLDSIEKKDKIVLHWFDILAIMIIGYWLGNFIENFLWWVF